MSDQHHPDEYDPSGDLTTLRGNGGAQDYLEVKFRLKWLRDQHPDAELTTEHIQLDDSRAVFRCLIRIPGDRGAASGYGSETPQDFRDYIEKAETKAIGRACAALGFGTQFVGSELEGKQGPRIVDAPVNRNAAPQPPRTPNAPETRQNAPGRASDGQMTNGSGQGANNAPVSNGDSYGAPSTTQPITDKQKKFLWAIAREKGLTEETLHAEASRAFGVSSVTELTRAQASGLIDNLQSRRPDAASEPPF